MSADSPAAIIFDENGNPVSVVLDGTTYRLAVDSILSDGYNQLGTATNPLRIDPVGQTVQPVMGMVVAQGNAPVGNSFRGYPVVIAGVDGYGNIQIPEIDGYGNVSVQQAKSSTANDGYVAATTSNVRLLSENPNRLGATIFNDSTIAILYLKLGVAASMTNYTVQVFPSGYYEVPYEYTGEIDGIWTASVGFATITELTQ